MARVKFISSSQGQQSGRHALKRSRQPPAHPRTEKPVDEDSDHEDSSSESDKPEHPNSSKSASFEKWILASLAGKKNSNMLSDYLESTFFQQTRDKVLVRTGIDLKYIKRILPVSAAIHAWGPKALDLVKFNTTSSITIDKRNAPAVVNDILKWLAKQQTVKTTRPRVRFHGQHDSLPDSMGLLANNCSQFFWFEGTLCSAEIIGSLHVENPLARMSRGEDPNSADDKPGQLVLRCLGWSNQPLRRLIGLCSVLPKDQLQFYEVAAGHRLMMQYWPKRPLETIDIEPEKLEDIKWDVEDYFHMDTKVYYKNAGTPHRRGLLLYSTPGCGKTSLSIAIASHMDKPLYQIRISMMDDNDLFEAFRQLPEDGCVVLMEDIDSAGVSREQMAKKNEEGKEDEKKGGEPVKEPVIRDEEEPEDELTRALAGSRYVFDRRQPSRAKPSTPKRVTLSGLLNVIDGAGAVENRLLIMATNAPDSLDKALYRPGRVDKIIYMDYSNKVTAACTFRRLFGHDPRNRYKQESIEKWAKMFAAQVPSKTFTPAKLANYCIGYRGQPQKAIENFGEFLKARREGKDEFQYDINNLRPEAAFDEEIPEEFNWDKDEECLENGEKHSSPSETGSVSKSTPASSIDKGTAASSLDPNEEMETLWSSFPWAKKDTPYLASQKVDSPGDAVDEALAPMVTAPTSPERGVNSCRNSTASLESSAELLARGTLRLRPVSPRPEELPWDDEEGGEEEVPEVLELYHGEDSEEQLGENDPASERASRWGFRNLLGSLVGSGERAEVNPSQHELLSEDEGPYGEGREDEDPRKKIYSSW